MNITGRILRHCVLNPIFNSTVHFQRTLYKASHCKQQNICSALASIVCKSINPLSLQSRDGGAKTVIVPTTRQAPKALNLPPLTGKPPLLYISPFAVFEVQEPPIIQREIVEPAVVKIEKMAIWMLKVRRRKMKKHQRTKWRKKYKFAIYKSKFRRARKREKELQDMLIYQVQMAESFSAEEYVKNTLKRIRDRPKPETLEEKTEKILDLMRKNKSNVMIIPPKMDDD